MRTFKYLEPAADVDEVTISCCVERCGKLTIGRSTDVKRPTPAFYCRECLTRVIIEWNPTPTSLDEVAALITNDAQI